MKDQPFKDVPLKYVKVGNNRWQDTHTGEKLNDSQVLQQTPQAKLQKHVEIMDKRWDLNN